MTSNVLVYPADDLTYSGTPPPLVNEFSDIRRRGHDKKGPIAVMGRYTVSLTMTRSIGDR